MKKHDPCIMQSDCRPGTYSAVFARKAFQLKPRLMKAELKMTAPCHYIPYINGKKPA